MLLAGLCTQGINKRQKTSESYVYGMYTLKIYFSPLFTEHIFTVKILSDISRPFSKERVDSIRGGGQVILNICFSFQHDHFVPCKNVC